ncbi:MAG: FHA domain-containing protein, partial [Deltaproteobacteria bacterium]|nr:FHA domain-containing protein [Kofleriaceae bacterium]
MPTLLYCDVDGVDRTFELGPHPVTIGRATDCAIRSDDPRMSRQHARMFFDGQQCWIEDLGSANGVFVGRDRVSRAAVPPGEVALVGSILVQVLGPQGPLPPSGGVHAQLSHWLAMERKSRAAMEDERAALARRLGELHEEMNTQARAASNELTAVLLQRDEAMGRAERLEDTLKQLQEELAAARTAPKASPDDEGLRERVQQLADEVAQLHERLAQAEAQAGEAEERLAEASSERDRLRDELNTGGDEAAELRKKLEAVRGERDLMIAGSAAEVERVIAEQKAAYEDQINGLRRELATVTEDLLVAETQAGVMAAEKLAAADRTVKTLEAELATLKKHQAGASADAARLAELKQQLDAADAHGKELEARVAETRGKLDAAE